MFELDRMFRCGHRVVFKPNDIIKSCPVCGISNGETIQWCGVHKAEQYLPNPERCWRAVGIYASQHNKPCNITPKLLVNDPDPRREMRERIAEEMWNRHRNQLSSPPWENANEDVRREFRSHAQVAIELMESQ